MRALNPSIAFADHIVHVLNTFDKTVSKNIPHQIESAKNNSFLDTSFWRVMEHDLSFAMESYSPATKSSAAAILTAVTQAYRPLVTVRMADILSHLDYANKLVGLIPDMMASSKGRNALATCMFILHNSRPSSEFVAEVLRCVSGRDVDLPDMLQDRQAVIGEAMFGALWCQLYLPTKRMAGNEIYESVFLLEPPLVGFAAAENDMPCALPDMSL